LIEEISIPTSASITLLQICRYTCTLPHYTIDRLGSQNLGEGGRIRQLNSGHPQIGEQCEISLSFDGPNLVYVVEAGV
jgi:hypothetical protein